MLSPKDAELFAVLSDNDLDLLADFLESDAAPEQAMDLSMLHGFLTAQLIGPEGVDADKWFAQVWGENGERPKFASVAEQEKIEGLILRLYNQLMDELADAENAFSPIVYVDEESGQDISQQWCYGFTLGTSMNPDAWQEMMDDEEYAQLVYPILVCADDEGRANLESDGQDMAEFEHEVAASLVDIIPEIRTFWLERREVPKHMH
jgi:uncharacterized protein